MKKTRWSLCRLPAALLLGLLSLAATAPLRGDDWPQWAGPDRQCQWREEGILDRFPAGGLKPSWVVKIGSGYSAPVVSQGRVFVVDYHPKPESKILEAIERVVCLDERTGAELWKHTWETHYRRQMRSYATGPRAAPLVDGERIYALGATGRLLCLNVQSGETIWEHDALEAFGAEVPTFGMAAAPLVWNDLVICPCGGRDGLLRAFDKKTGEPRWKALAGAYELPYSSPMLFRLAGVEQLVQWDQQQLSGLNPETGAVLWQAPFRARSNMALGNPVLAGPDLLLVSGFYDGSMLVRAGRDAAEVVWKVGGESEQPDKTRGLHAVITTPIVSGDHFFGTCSYGELRGLRLADSERVWESAEATRQGRWGSLFWVKHRDRYFVNNDLGELLIMKFSARGPEVLDRAKLIEPDTHCGYGPRRFADALVNWVQPAYANRHIIVRNDSEIRRISLESK